MRPVLDDSVRLTDEGVRILDRRVFPTREEWVLARSAGEVAVAIREMVTQSSGPFYAGLAGLRLSARLHRADALETALKALADDGELLTAARPTNNHVRDAVREVLEAVGTVRSADELAELVEAETARLEAAYRGGSAELGRLTAELIPDGARVMTHCWMDAYLIGLVQEASRAGRSYDWVVTETRPYLQGARLTAHTLAEMGQSLTLITDSTAASVLAGQGALGPVDALVTAADRVTMDGHVINKVGTLSHAVAASAFDIPFYALVLAPDRTAATASDVVIEERDGAEVLSTLGARTASSLVERGYYPAFDVTPPQFVRRIVTDRGVFEPARVGEYHSISEEQNR
ncbi:methylthioribose-1-phosphate isomerase [Cryptosporangium sp. NPDC048952]|uniref:methylthioribose-1-phosphate isomerase n=1 Tax=Cryptosporangium sp. NPDC048952 TaxID=3363961 RepID=UPI003719A326